jgi:WD40 repeat protein
MTAGCRQRPTLVGARIGRQEGVVDVAFLRDGAHVVAAEAGAEGTINVWDVRARRIARSFRVGRALSLLALDEARGVLAVASWATGARYQVALLDLATGRQVGQLDEGQPIYGLDRLFVAREGWLTSYADRGVPEASMLWSFQTGRQLAHFERPADALSGDRRTVLGGRVIWTLADGRPRGELPPGARVWGHALSADGSRAVSERRGAGILWDQRGELLRTFDDQPTSTARAAFSPDDRFLITARYPETLRRDRRLLVLRDARTGQLLAELPGHEKTVRAVAFSPDGASAVSGGLRGELIHWTMPR